MQSPRPHQVEAISACLTGLKKPHSRGQCIMACGTGKTLVGYEVAQRLKAKRVLALVPSLLLVNQLAKEYRKQGATHIMSVCSDESAGGEDALHISVKELETDNTTDAAEARAFLDGPGQRIVVCTYQSLRSLSKVFEGLAFDLAIFDEAHKTAGNKSKLFAHALQDNGLKCSRRLFMTATPRHAKLKEDGSESQVFAMNDPKVYGPVLYSLPLRTAIEAGIIDDYRIIIGLVSQQNTEDLKEQAIRVAIDKARRLYGIRKVFSFHALVADAKGFVSGATDTLHGMRLYHVNGKQSSIERALALEGFRNAEAALMSNARCLTDGVDLPAADMVAFLAPKRNPIDIVQSVGRVLRRHESKTSGGYVFLPVFERDGEDEEAAIAESDWDGCYEVLHAMREQDEPLSVALSKYARGEGELPGQIEIMDGRGKREDVEVDSVQLSEGMRKAIRVKMTKPFMIDPNGKKKALIEMARAGTPRPHSTNTVIGQAFSSYLNKSGGSYDPDFISLIRTIAPEWVDRSWKFKKLIVGMAENENTRPSMGSPIGAAFKRMTTPGHTQYDPAFHEHMKAIAPSWFMKNTRTPNEVKNDILNLAKSGGEKPFGSLGKSFSAYTDERSNKYDSEFASELVSLAPLWFVDKTEQSKKTLLEMAKSGHPMPCYGSYLRSFLSRRNNKNKKEYDPQFIKELRKRNPSWPLEAGEKRQIFKEEILRYASECSGKSKASSLPVHLNNPSSRYTHEGGEAFDQEFTEQLRRLAPHWFRKPKETA